jgi:catechol-2,3-dioxygenase
LSIAVLDPRASAQWWISNFNLEEYTRSDARILLGNDSIVLSLTKGRPDPTVLRHLAFRTRDMAALELARDILREGGVDLEDPGDEIGAVAEGLWFHDIDGYRWELFVQG